jgi:hypothetical protein
MDDEISSRDLPAEPAPPAEHLRAVPGSTPPAPPREKKRPGPKTPRGKARSSRNAIRSGIHATDPVIPGERPEDWQAHHAGVLASVERPTYLDTLLAEIMASASWRLKRVMRYEVTEFTRANTGSPVFLLPPGTELDKIMKYEAHLSRQFYQAQHELEAREKLRRGEAAPLGRLDLQGALALGALDGVGDEPGHHDGQAPRVLGVTVTAGRQTPRKLGGGAQTPKQIERARPGS